MVTMELDDPTGYGRVVRGADGNVEHVVETKSPGDATAERARHPRGQHRHLRVRAPARCSARSTSSPPTTPRASYYLPDALKAIAPRAGPWPPSRSTTPRLTLGVNDRVDLGRVRALAQRRILERHMRAGVTSSTRPPRSIDVDVEIGAGHGHRAGDLPARRPRRSASAAAIGPATTLIDAVLGDEVTIRHSYLDRCEVRAGGTVGPFAYLRPERPAARGRQGGHVRGDQELGHRRGDQGAAPVLHRRRRRRRGLQPRRRHDHRQLRRLRQAPHDDRRRRARRRRHRLRRAGRGRRRAWTAAGSVDDPGRPARRARRRARAPAQRRGIRRASVGADP